MVAYKAVSIDLCRLSFCFVERLLSRSRDREAKDINCFLRAIHHNVRHGRCGSLSPAGTEHSRLFVLWRSDLSAPVLGSCSCQSTVITIIHHRPLVSALCLSFFAPVHLHARSSSTSSRFHQSPSSTLRRSTFRSTTTTIPPNPATPLILNPPLFETATPDLGPHHLPPSSSPTALVKLHV